VTRLAGSLLALIGLVACGPGLAPTTVPSTEKLRAEDCQLGQATLAERVQHPENASIVVTNRPQSPPSPEAQALALLEFASECQAAVGKARRAVVRCWLDAVDAPTLRACLGRF